MAIDRTTFDLASAKRVAQATQWVEQERSENVLDRFHRRGHVPTGSALAFAKADITAGASGTVYMATGEALSEVAGTEERTVYNSLLGTVSQDSLCLIQIPAVIDSGTSANWHIVASDSTGTDFHADVLGLTLGEDLDDNETDISVSASEVVSPKGASATVPTVDKVKNTRMNLVAGNAESALVLYDKKQSTVAGEEIWEVIGVDSHRIFAASMSRGTTQTITAGGSSTLQFSTNLNNDPSGFADQANNRFVVPARDGWIILRCQIEVSAADSASSALVISATVTLSQSETAYGVTQDILGTTGGGVTHTLIFQQLIEVTSTSNITFTVAEALGNNNVSVDNIYAECFYLPPW